MTEIIVFFHDNCTDGYAACWTAFRKFGHLAKYVACSYDQFEGKPISHTFLESVAGKEVYVVDFCFPLALVEEVANVAKSLVILDHHKTARASLDGFGTRSNTTIVFDMEHSGAVLAWRYFHPGDERFLLLKYVEDYDLWRFALPDSKFINAYIRTVPFEFAAWDELYTGFNGVEYAQRGKAVADREEQILKLTVKNAFYIRMFGHERIPCVNASAMISASGERMLRDHPTAPFSASFFIKDGFKVWSLRSRPGTDVDVSIHAKLMGGGGHKHAAGFQEKINMAILAKC